MNATKAFSEELNSIGAKLVISTPTPEFPQASLKRCNYQNDQWFNKFSRVNCSTPKEFFTKKDYIINTKIFKNCEHRIPTEGSSIGLQFLKKNLYK